MGYVPSGAKLTIWNEIYKRGSKAGIKDTSYSYEGKNPQKLIEFVPKLIQDIFAPTTWQQKDVTFKEGKYECVWFVFKDLDNFSYFKVDVELDIGYKDGVGKAKVKLGEPVIVTEYPQETIWQQSFFYEVFRVAWHNMFYGKKVEEYLDWARVTVADFEEKLFRYFDKLKNE